MRGRGREGKCTVCELYTPAEAKVSEHEKGTEEGNATEPHFTKFPPD
jgi:hypothetical protein